MPFSFIKKNFLTIIFLSVLILITYLNSINNVFLSDDLADIANNPDVSSLSYTFSRPFGPIRPFLYWLAYQIGGLNPPYFRLINIFFHTGSTILVFFLFNKLLNKKTAIFISSIFAVHPAISEGIVWISGGMYPQYTFFFLLSFIFYLKQGHIKYYLISVITYLLAFMSHPQMPIPLMVIFPLYEFCFGSLKKNWLKSIPFVLISIFYVLLSVGALPERQTTLQSVHYREPGFDNPLVLFPVALSSYFELVFFPKILTLYHSELNFNVFQFTLRTIMTLGFLIGILFSIKKNRFIFFWLSFSIIALLPTLTPFRLTWIVAERYLYLPLIGILAVVGLGFDYLTKKPKFKTAAMIVFIIALLLFSIRTIIRNIDWKNEDNLWIATGKTSPSSPNTHNNLGDVYGRLGDKQKSLQEFQTAIALKPNYADAYHNAGNVLREMGQTDKALEYYQKASEINPRLWQSYQNIGAIYFELKKFELSLENLNKAIGINPKNLNLHLSLGIVYLNMGDKTKAKEVFNQILAVLPDNQVAKQGLIEAGK